MSVDWTKPIQTVDGKKARLLGELKTLHTENDNKVVAVELPTGYECVYTLYENGRFSLHREDPRDIINVPPRKVMREVEAWAVITDGRIKFLTQNGDEAKPINCHERTVRLTGAIEVEVEE